MRIESITLQYTLEGERSQRRGFPEAQQECGKSQAIAECGGQVQACCVSRFGLNWIELK